MNSVHFFCKQPCTEPFGTGLFDEVTANSLQGQFMSFYETKSIPSKPTGKAFAIAIVMVSLSACTVGPDYSVAENTINIQQWSDTTNQSDGLLIASKAVNSDWWKIFQDPLLTSLEKELATKNLDIQLAMNRIEESRSLLGITKSEQLPSLGLGGNYSRYGLSDNGKFAALGAPTQANNFWQVGFDASWELDLWGKFARSKERAMAQFMVTQYEQQGVYVAISAQLARIYLQLRGVQAQIDLTEKNLQIAKRTVELTESRERNGVGTRFETSTSLAQLASIKAMMPELKQRRSKLMNALALLLGEQPHSLDERLKDVIPLPVLAKEIPVGVPSELAHRRPDILTAEAKLHAATAEIGVAKANFYPRIAINGQIGGEAFEYTDLGSWSSRFFSIGPSVYLPIFQGGKLTQKLELTEIKQKSAAIRYRQTVLNAWHEVDDALSYTAAQVQQHKDLSIAYQQHKRAFDVAERNFQEGVSDYLQVLTAQKDVLLSETKLNLNKTQSTLSLVNLYKALGGGWN